MNKQQKQQSTDTVIAENRQKIEHLFEQEELDHASLLELITLRDQLITQHIATLVEPHKKAFAQSELLVNQQLEEKVKLFFNDVEQQLGKLMHSRKVIKKYK